MVAVGEAQDRVAGVGAEQAGVVAVVELLQVAPELGAQQSREQRAARDREGRTGAGGS
jgi:hypothetical protein